MPGRKKTDEVLIQAIACGASVESAARKANICARTAYRRLADPAVQERITQVRADTAQRLNGMATVASLEGIKTLVTLQDASYPPHVRLRAAESSVELGVKLREESDLLRRFNSLDQVVRARIEGPQGVPSYEHPVVILETTPSGEPVGTPRQEEGESDPDGFAS